MEFLVVIMHLAHWSARHKWPSQRPVGRKCKPGPDSKEKIKIMVIHGVAVSQSRPTALLVRELLVAGIFPGSRYLREKNRLYGCLGYGIGVGKAIKIGWAKV